jgi:hypothetical protein
MIPSYIRSMRTSHAADVKQRELEAARQKELNVGHGDVADSGSARALMHFVQQTLRLCVTRTAG